MRQDTIPASRRSWSSLQVVAVAVVCALLGHGLARVMSSPDKTKISARHSASFVVKLSSTANAPSADTASSASASDAPLWKIRWQQFHDQAPTPQRDRQLANLIEELARSDHEQALALVAAESNWRLSDELRDATLRGWASDQPNAAGDHALKIRLEDRRKAVAAVLAGAADQPDSAVKLALRLCAADPEIAGDYGHSAVAVLVENGHFEHAIRFGQSIGTDKFPFLLRSAYYQWSRNDPAAASASAQRIEDTATRDQIIAETFSGWAHVDARALTEYARTLPAGPLRENALSESLPKWVERDPDAATGWINQQETHGELDAGIVAIANLQSLIKGRPSTAMDLAASIFDPQRRADTLRTVFRQWAANDPAAATRYASAASTTDRPLLDAELKDMQPN